METNYMIYDFDCEKKDIPVNVNKSIILDVKNLRSASTTFLHKLLDAKNRIVVVNLHGQPEQVFNICGLGSVVKICKNIDEAKNYLNDKYNHELL